jgi:hypothetical protein
MNGGLKYSTACVNKPAEASRFLNRHLNFVSYQNEAPGTGDSSEGVLIGNKFGNNYLLCPPAGRTENLNETIIINTDNCLRDFHQLKNAGIQIEKAPKYTANGLEAVIADNYGNRYLLVEKRDYSD